jgi:hypothetical protein
MHSLKDGHPAAFASKTGIVHRKTRSSLLSSGKNNDFDKDR